MGSFDAAAATVDRVVASMGVDGYCVVEGLLSPEGLREARTSLAAVLDATPRGRNDFEGFGTKRVYALFAKTRAFDRPAVDPLVLGVLDRILGHYQLSAPTGIQIGPGEKAQPLHRDEGIYPLPRSFPDVVVNTMWALDDFTARNGATRLIPGSHRWEDRSPGMDDELVPAIMPAIGHVLPRQGVARRRGQSDGAPADGRHPRVRRRLAAAPGEPRAGRAPGDGGRTP